jgi:Na+-transporting NADH:ubiquinone oxidoreductase subunit A
VPIHYCTGDEVLSDSEKNDTFSYCAFKGPHPAGLPSTHIHFLDPVNENKTVWHIDYQDIIALGHLLDTGYLREEKVISLAGPATLNPSLVTTRTGAYLPELCRKELVLEDVRVISGSVLSGHESSGNLTFLGRYHNQVSVLADDSGRSFLNWAMPGGKRFSVRPMFLSALKKKLSLPFTTALWGGKRAIYPLGTYDQVMPLDILATSLLKTLFSSQDTEKARDLGCLELVEDDLALCSFVCPGKNEFGPPLRRMLTAIEQGY